jgi:WD40 repeat protein
VLRPRAGTRAVAAGVFDVRQRPGSAEVVCTTTSPAVDVLRLRRTPPGAAGCDDNNEQRQQQQGGFDYHYEVACSLVGHTGACPTSRTLGDLVVTASFDDTLKLFRPPQARAAAAAAPGGAPLAVHAVATLDDAAPAPAPGAPPGPAGGVCALALGPGAAQLVSGGNDMQVKVWDVAAGRVTLRLRGHEGWVWLVEPLGEGLSSVVTAATDGTARVWDLRAGAQVAALDFSQRHQGEPSPHAAEAWDTCASRVASWRMRALLRLST